ncbi:MAG: HlyD family efflux transporter periplasmic adaptor subunit [Acidobacteriota bacterium]|nr:HlyD family efflux transporter periplasmic adaptor subunit [Acidobacteriota bacterium]
MSTHAAVPTHHYSKTMKAEYLSYPPRTAGDVEVIEQRDGNRLVFIVGSALAGRFLLLGETECRVLRLLTGTLIPAEVCEEFKRLYLAKLTLPTLKKFLGRLDEAGILAGERASVAASSDPMPGPQFYARWKLFNPDRLFEKIVARLPWIWTKGFVIGTLLLMCLALLLSLMRPAEVTSYTLYIMREHYLAVFLAAVLVGFSHEFAHGLTCKAFGGRVPELGVLMIYYLLPALYCNVSGAYLIHQRSRRLWVIFAGIYWQVLVGAFTLLIWFAVQPYTLISDLAFIFFLGSVVDVIFNANPLIKLDGYYFLSQFLQLPNLMERSCAYWRGLLKRFLFGERDNAAQRWGRRVRTVYAVFGLTSFAYTVALRILIVVYVGSYLADEFNLAGLMAAAALGGFYMRGPLGQMASAIRQTAGRIYETLFKPMREGVMRRVGEKNSDETRDKIEGGKTNIWRRRLVWIGLALIAAAGLCMPWNASVGSYGTLVAIPDLEAIVRAPEDATLIELRAQPGEVVSSGGLLGRLGNLELEEQIVQAQSESTRANADYARLLGELRAREEAAAHAGLQLSRRRHDFDEINFEQEQINQRLTLRATRKVRPANHSSPSDSSSPYPAAMAVFQADVDMIEGRLQEATLAANRSRELFSHGVVSRSEFESATTRAASLSFELVRARERLEAALIEHRRRHTTNSIELQQAGSNLRAEHLQTALLNSQLHAARELIGVLESRLDVLRRKRAQFELVTPVAGTIYGEDLLRMVRRYFHKGEEICRVADTRELLARIQLPEREIGDVRVAHHVRLRVRAYPNREFHGVVSKIGGEAERDEHNQTTYRVELSIENAEGLLRPGMTAFARIDFGRQMIGQILVHKVKQLLRPEMWML